MQSLDPYQELVLLASCLQSCTGLCSCRCPIPEEEVEGNCPICKGGKNGDIPNPDKLILPFTNCDGIAQLAATTKVGRECEEHQKVAGLYCGCPKKMALKTKDDDDACHICGEGKELLSTSATVMFNDSVMLCGELELTANIDQEYVWGVPECWSLGVRQSYTCNSVR
jgi:hypothetical protein